MGFILLAVGIVCCAYGISMLAHKQTTVGACLALAGVVLIYSAAKSLGFEFTDFLFRNLRF